MEKPASTIWVSANGSIKDCTLSAWESTPGSPPSIMVSIISIVSRTPPPVVRHPKVKLYIQTGAYEDVCI